MSEFVQEDWKLKAHAEVKLRREQAGRNWTPVPGVCCGKKNHLWLCKLCWRIQNVDVTNKKLILAATAARQKYSAYLSELHTKEAICAKSTKRKVLQEELEQLKTKKRRLQKDAEALEKDLSRWPCCYSRTEAWFHGFMPPNL